MVIFLQLFTRGANNIGGRCKCFVCNSMLGGVCGFLYVSMHVCQATLFQGLTWLMTERIYKDLWPFRTGGKKTCFNPCMVFESVGPVYYTLKMGPANPNITQGSNPTWPHLNVVQCFPTRLLASKVTLHVMHLADALIQSSLHF